MTPTPPPRALDRRIDPGVDRRLAGVAVGVVIGALASFVVVLRINPIFDPDYFWHLATGDLVLRTHRVPTVDPFSHTFSGAPWRFVDWLSDVLMAALHRVGGDDLVVVSFALVGGAAVAVTLVSAWRARASVVAVTIAGLLLVPAVAFRISPRPQTLTFLILAVEMALIVAARASPRRLALAPLSIVVWQNVHSSAVLGWLVLVAFAVGVSVDAARGLASAELRKHAWYAALAGAVALLVAVHPLDRLRAGFDHVGDPRVALLFEEWSPLWRLRSFYPASIAFAVTVVLIVVSLATSTGRRAPGLGLLAIALGVAIVGTATLRFLPLAALALAPIAAIAVDALLARAGLETTDVEPVVTAARRRGVRATLGAIVAGFAALATLLSMRHRRAIGFGIEPGTFPIDAAAFVRAERPRGRLYNDFQYGGYLLWALGDDYPVFVDGRSMAVYGIDFVAQVALADDVAFDRLLDAYDVGIAIAPTHQRTGWFQHRPGWALVYFDDTAFVAVRTRDNAELVAAHAYRRLEVARWQEMIEALRGEPALLDAARAEAIRATREAPSASLPWVLRAAVELAAGDAGAADFAIAQAIRRDPKGARPHRAKLIRCVEARAHACVCAEATAVLNASPGNAYATTIRAREACP